MERTYLEIIARRKGLNDGRNDLIFSNGSNKIQEERCLGSADRRKAFVAFPGFDERQFFYRIGEEVGVGGG